jgi:arsenate reductase (thioredoxin)
MTDTSKTTRSLWRILFLCTHNSARSQMAEGLLRARGGDAYEVFSAGTEARIVHPLAIQVMGEIGIDISAYRSKGMDEFSTQPAMDLVVTVCDEAAEACPFFPHAHRQVHWGFSDPSRVEGDETERLVAFQQTRDLIEARIHRFLKLQPTTSLEQLYAAAKAQE